MHGSSIHARYEFDNARPVTPHFSVGDVRMKKIELLDTGRTVLIVSGRHSSEIKRAAEQEGMVNLRQDARAKILEGTTTVEEVLRVTSTAL